MDEHLNYIASQDMPPPPALPAAFLDEIQSSEPVKTRVPKRDWALYILLSAAISGVFLYFGGFRSDMQGLTMAWIVVYAAFWIIGFGVISRLAIVPNKESMMPAFQRCLWATGVACVLAIGVGFVAPHLVADLPHTHEDDVVAVMKHGQKCLRFGIASAIVPTLLGLFLLRGIAPMRSKRVAATIGAAGGALAGCMLHFHCSMNGSIHLGLAHGGVVVISALIAILFSSTLVPKS